MLTRKQKELLLLIRDRLAADGVPPSFDEMKEALGLRSKSGIHRLITGLEERGFIKRLPHRARALEITRLPEGMETAKGAKSGARKPAKLPGNMPDLAAIAMAQSIRLPLYGRIAAGSPIEALHDPNGQIDVPLGLIAANARGKIDADDHYALEVAGDSMIEAGIMDGDRVIIRKCDTAENGAIVVALVGSGEDDGANEVTLKRLKKRDNKIDLIPANKNLQTKTYAADQVKVQGKLVGLVRQY
jgi:repressor LexA